jgi:hypothetical protein
MPRTIVTPIPWGDAAESIDARHVYSLTIDPENAAGSGGASPAPARKPPPDPCRIACSWYVFD